MYRRMSKLFTFQLYDNNDLWYNLNGLDAAPDSTKYE